MEQQSKDVGSDTANSLMSSKDSDEQFFGHLWAMLDFASQESQPACTGISRSDRNRYRASVRKHARWLAGRAGVCVTDPRGRELIEIICGGAA